MSVVSAGSYVVTEKAFHRDESGRFLSEVHAGAVRSAFELAQQIADMARIFAPRRRGILAASIRVFSFGTRGEAVADAPWAAPQEEGAVPHPIPNAFGWGITVMHPGNPAVHYMLRGGRAVAQHSDAVIRANMPAV